MGEYLLWHPYFPANPRYREKTWSMVRQTQADLGLGHFPAQPPRVMAKMRALLSQSTKPLFYGLWTDFAFFVYNFGFLSPMYLGQSDRRDHD